MAYPNRKSRHIDATPAIIASVNAPIKTQQDQDDYQVATELYEGPLDLLLSLIERAELDITRLALAQVTDQYLAHLEHLPTKDPAEVSSFLVIAARLVQIKSAVLLPRPPSSEPLDDEMDAGEALARQLIIYKRFKELSAHIGERHDKNLRTYYRLAAPRPQFEPRFDVGDLTVEDLRQAARTIFSIARPMPELSTVVNIPRVTIREKITVIMEKLQRDQVASFRSILKARNRPEVVVSFLAMLELVKRHLVEAQQDQLFGDIFLKSLKEWDSSEITDFEFGD
jgi:segregation and condensation protein A